MRIIFNTSFIINEDIENEWINFIRQRYITPLKKEQICFCSERKKNDSTDQRESKKYCLDVYTCILCKLSYAYKLCGNACKDMRRDERK